MSRTGPSSLARSRARFDLWMTALVSAPFVVESGCTPNVELGAMDSCGDQGVICDLDGVFSDATFPLGEAQYPDFNRAAFEQLSAGMEGTWHGVVAGVETIFPRFEMQFFPGADEGAGEFVVDCLGSPVCVPIGSFEDSRAFGKYRLIYADRDRAGQGEFTWPFAGAGQSTRFRNLLLQRSDQVLFFVVDIALAGSFQFVMQRGPWPDAGVEEPGEPANPDAPRPSVDAGTSMP